jgi:hypothetical protein
MDIRRHISSQYLVNHMAQPVICSAAADCHL